MKRPFLVAFIGLVGSGKTFIAKRLAWQLNATHIRTDNIRWELEKKGKSSARAIPIARQRTIAALKEDKSVILDADAVNPKRHRELKAFARRFGARLYFIQVKTPEKLILQRLRAQRYPKPGLANLNQALLAYFSRKKFHQKKLRLKPVFVIDNSKPLAPQIARIVKQIKEG